MADHYTGRCACGAVTLEAGAAPVAMRQCWCRRCQRLAGGGPTNNAMFQSEALSVTGTTAKTGYTADSGAEIIWEFCPTCATPILAHAAIRPHLRTVRIGLIDQPHDLHPQAVIWTSEAPPWAIFDPALPHFPAQPPAPGKQD